MVAQVVGMLSKLTQDRELPGGQGVTDLFVAPLRLTKRSRSDIRLRVSRDK